MTTMTIFTWGYYGWGNHTVQLVQVVDEVEARRGYLPPLFVDIRIRRNVRAKGFQGNAFANLLGPGRYCWLKSLGNRFIQTRPGPVIQIANPPAAGEILDLALESARHKQRLVFFCSCQWPRDGNEVCHRTSVAELVLEAAKKRGVGIEVVEWPGGESKQIDLEVSPQVLAAVRRGRKTVPLGKHPGLAEVGGVPWCSIATLHSNGEKLHRLVGPAIYQQDQWVLPFLCQDFGPATNLCVYEKGAGKLRQVLGLVAIIAP
jgi:hypothetical protein